MIIKWSIKHGSLTMFAISRLPNSQNSRDYSNVRKKSEIPRKRLFTERQDLVSKLGKKLLSNYN